MGHHINEHGQFQSDRHPDLPPNKIILSFRDQAAREALKTYARFTPDNDLARDITRALVDQDWPEPACRVCGCTEQNPCPGGCHWVEHDLCSACEGKNGTHEHP